MPNAVAGPDDLINLGALGDLTEVQRAAVQMLLDGVVAGLETRLGRWLGVREAVQTLYPDKQTGLLNPSGSPLVEVISLTVGGVAPSGPIPLWMLEHRFAYNDVPVVLRYRAGVDLNADPGRLLTIRQAVLMKALPYAQALIARAEAAAMNVDSPETATAPPRPAPGVKNFAVEGLSVGYDSAAAMTSEAVKAAQDLGAAITWTEDDLAPLMTFKRRVVA